MPNVAPTVDVGRLSYFPSSQPELIQLKEFHSPGLLPLHCAELWDARIKSFPGRVIAILCDTCSQYVQLWFPPTPQPRLPGTHFGSSMPSSSFTQLPLAAQRYSPGRTQGTHVTLNTPLFRSQVYAKLQLLWTLKREPYQTS